MPKANKPLDSIIQSIQKMEHTTSSAIEEMRRLHRQIQNMTEPNATPDCACEGVYDVCHEFSSGPCSDFAHGCSRCGHDETCHADSQLAGWKRVAGIALEHLIHDNLTVNKKGDFKCKECNRILKSIDSHKDNCSVREMHRIMSMTREPYMCFLCGHLDSKKYPCTFQKGEPSVYFDMTYCPDYDDCEEAKYYLEAQEEGREHVGRHDREWPVKN